jgi:hypothetical protein
VLYYATLHEHPLVGGYIGRMPRDAPDRYDRMPVAGDLLKLSSGRSAGSSPPTDTGPCDYVVVTRDTTPSALRDYLARLPIDKVESDERRDLYASHRRGSPADP